MVVMANAFNSIHHAAMSAAASAVGTGGVQHNQHASLTFDSHARHPSKRDDSWCSSVISYGRHASCLHDTATPAQRNVSCQSCVLNGGGMQCMNQHNICRTQQDCAPAVCASMPLHLALQLWQDLYLHRLPPQLDAVHLCCCSTAVKSAFGEENPASALT